MSLTTQNINQWASDVESDPVASLAGTVFRNVDAHKALVSQKSIVNAKHEFSDVIEVEGSPITNQKASGRCWIFAATNLFRIALMKKYNIGELQLSQTYLFFYDKLEKSNYFLNQIIDTAGEEVDGRLVSHLLFDPITDGGQFDMIVSLVEKYGLVPQTLYPDSFNSTSSRRCNEMITTKLRQYAQELREAIAAGKDAHALRNEQMKEVFKLLSMFFGTPPPVDQEFTWEYRNKDKKFESLKATPMSFYKEVVGLDVSNAVSLLNDPRNKYERVIKVDRLGNVHGSKDVSYLNLDIDELSKVAIEKIKRNEPVFFGSHTPMYMDREKGIFDMDLWDYKLIGYNPSQDKTSRLYYGQSLMTHAMVLTGVHLVDGKPTRWKVENSWGDEVGKKGYFVMTHDYFKEYVYQIVADKSEIGDLAKHLEDPSPIVLPPWDPMGALA